jgi:hypothetical protein
LHAPSFVHQALASEALSYFSRREEIFSDLLAEKITVGEFNKAFVRNFSDWTASYNRVAAEITSSLVQLDQEERAATRAAIGAAILNRPRITNCAVFGNQVTCTNY